MGSIIVESLHWLVVQDSRCKGCEREARVKILVRGFSDRARPVLVLNHVLDAAFELTNHEEDKVDEEDLPDDRNVEERNKGQKEGDEEIAREEVPVNG